VGIDKKLEIMAEMLVLCSVMFLAAFFCFRMILLPEAIETTIDKTYEAKESLSQKR
jgi:hypothetical protein